MTDNFATLPRSSWKDALEELSTVHAGAVLTIEVDAPDLGDQYEAERLPLAYIEYDPHDDAASVAVGGRDGRFPVVLRHVIDHPESIVVDASGSEEATAVEIVAPDGTKTIIKIFQLPELPQ